MSVDFAIKLIIWKMFIAAKKSQELRIPTTLSESDAVFDALRNISDTVNIIILV